MNKTLKWILISVLLLTCIIAAVSAGVVWVKVKGIENTKLSNDSPVMFDVYKGDTLYQVKKRLLAYADIDSLGFKVWLRLNSEYTHIQTGHYEIAAGASLTSVLTMLKDRAVKQYSITLVEGHTAAQWLSQLASNSNIEHDIHSESAFYSTLISADNSFCVNEMQKLEGCLLPNTYFFEKYTRSSQILQRAFSAMRLEIDAAWDARFDNLPIDTRYQALILASIVEKETAVETERTEIAGVFINRLNKRMRLQTDPTVIYGLGDEYKGNITRKHLRTYTPYNTRIIKGLTPTPIAMPSKASIRAAIQPATTDSLYFVATGYGGHTFSTNLADHNKAVRAYLKYQKSLGN